MGWAARHIEALRAGKTVRFRPHGHSMQGRISSGQLVTVEPLPDLSLLAVNDIVLCKVGGSELLHLVKDIRNGLYQIGNNRGKVNGWVGASSIFARCVRVDP